ncbi:MAG TPA: hypothetical protein PKH77_23990 [Anaerolineae bacterium]|nr:hypothetical protein [Anaerolineae bacterium]
MARKACFIGVIPPGYRREKAKARIGEDAGFFDGVNALRFRTKVLSSGG